MKKQRALLFDAGNTRLKWAIVDDACIVRTAAIEQATIQQHGCTKLLRKIPKRVQRVLVSSVSGPSYARAFAKAVSTHCGVEPEFLLSSRKQGGVTNGYRTATQLGVDRWMALLGARAEFKGNLCIVDAGTAVTIDALNKRGEHLGGQILPGLGLMTSTLLQDTREIATARAAVKSQRRSASVFAKGTQQAVDNGVLSAVCGAIERNLRMMRQQRMRPKLILTGGDASRILNALSDQGVYRPDLVLSGMLVVLNTRQ